MARRKDNRNNESLIDVVFPDTLDLECQVLSDLIQNPEMIVAAQSGLRFCDWETEGTWQVLCELSGKGITPDLTMLQAKVSMEIVTRIARATPAGPMQTEQHIQALRQMSVRHELYDKAREIVFDSVNPGSDFDKLISMPGKLNAAISGNTGYGNTARTLSEVYNDFANEIEMIQKGETTRVPTGIPGLDKITYSGFNAGNLIVLAARPSIGKSALMLQMALAAARGGFPALIESLEMTESEIMDRLTWSTGLVTPIQRGNNTVAFDNLERAFREFQDIPVFINDKPKSLDQLCGDIIMENQRGRCSIAFIDHLGKIRPSDNKQPRYQVLGEMTKRLKDLSKECKIPVVLLCQLNRNLESEGRPPQLYDLRDSGEIEEDADIVLMLERAAHSKDDPDINMWVRKNRQGPADVCIYLTGSRYMTVFESRDPARMS